MPKPLHAVGLVLLGACALLLWHLSSTVSELRDQVGDLEAAITDLQLTAGSVAPSTPALPLEPGAGRAAKVRAGKNGRGDKSAKAGKSGKARKGGAGRDRGAQMAEILASFASDNDLDDDTRTGLEDALTTLNTSVKASRAASTDGDPSSMREQRQALFAEFEATVNSLLEPDQAEDLMGQIKTSRGGPPPGAGGPGGGPG